MRKCLAHAEIPRFPHQLESRTIALSESCEFGLKPKNSAGATVRLKAAHRLENTRVALSGPAHFAVRPRHASRGHIGVVPAAAHPRLPELQRGGVVHTHCGVWSFSALYRAQRSCLTSSSGFLGVRARLNLLWKISRVNPRCGSSITLQNR